MFKEKLGAFEGVGCSSIFIEMFYEHYIGEVRNSEIKAY